MGIQENIKQGLPRTFLFKKGGGFTLIELLVVIAIISLLATLAVTALNNARRKSRDAKRLSDVRQIRTALELYYDKYYTWPARTADSCCDGWDQGPCAPDPVPETFIQVLVTERILNPVPVDPGSFSGTGCYGYNYYVYNAGAYGCTASKGRFYVLGVVDMETADYTYTALDDGTTRVIYEGSPGWHCPEGTGATRDWQDEYDYVIGQFEFE